MWISKQVGKEIERIRDERDSVRELAVKLNARIEMIERENATLKANIDWFQHRLNHVELERAQLVDAAINVKLRIPQFEGARQETDEEVMQRQMPDFGRVGEDALDDPGTVAIGTGTGDDPKLMDGYQSTGLYQSALPPVTMRRP